MINRVKARLVKYLGHEKGQALLSVLVFLVIGSLTLPPVLSHLGTSLKTGRVYEKKTNELYAADSGIEDALWLIKYDRLESFFTDPDYDVYDFDAVWSYNLSDDINSLTTDVSIQNVWIPKDVSPLSPTQGRGIIESSKLVITGSVTGEASYKMKISFYPGEGEEDDLMVDSLGIWLPIGSTYTADSSNLEADPFADYYSIPSVYSHAGGQAVVWDFASVPFQDFPGIVPDDIPMTTDITFGFTPSQPGISPTAISWIETSGVSDVPLSWDADNKVYRITSLAGATEIEAYSVKCGLRKLGAAIEGDYRAIGNSLMIDTYPDSYDIRDELLDESDAEVYDIASDAEVIAAFLYWSGWFAEGVSQPILEDDCKDFGNWISGSCWNINDGHFISHYSSGEPSTRYCTLKNSLDLSSFDPGTVRVCWEHWEEGDLEGSGPWKDALQFQFSGDGGSSWSYPATTAFTGDIGTTPQYFCFTVPSLYLTDDFKFRFYLYGFNNTDEFCHVDNFAINAAAAAADTSVIFRIDDAQVYLDEEGDPQTGDEEITASQSSVLENEPGEYSYACFCDVTKLVKEFSDQGDHENHTGNGEYTVGGVYAETGNQWSYAGWSLVIIFGSSETHGHQLYLYDDFIYSDCVSQGMLNVDFDGDGEPGGAITGFIVPEPIGGEEYAATLTCFVGEGDDCWAPDSLKFNSEYLFNAESPWDNVWNSQSPGMSKDGVDIDTFYITWASGLLEPGDSSAQLDLETQNDSWNLVYIILSLRSETVTGGTVHYVIHG